MAYIIQTDLLTQIQQQELTKIQTGNATVLPSSIGIAMEEMRSYLVPKYNMAAEFTDTAVYEYSKTYKAGNRVYLDAPAYSATATYALNDMVLQAGNVYKCKTAITTGEAFNIAKWDLLGAQYTLFYVTLPKLAFDMYAAYARDNEVFYKDHTYKCLIATIYPGHETQLQYDNTAAIPRTNVLPDDPKEGTKYWQDLGAYSISANTWPTDATKWTQGDNRNQLFVAHFVAMVLYHMHRRVSPQNIPVHRVEAYMGKDEDRVYKEGRLYYPEYSALGFIQAASLGRNTANLPVTQPKKGKRLLWNSEPRDINRY